MIFKEKIPIIIKVMGWTLTNIVKESDKVRNLHSFLGTVRFETPQWMGIDEIHLISRPRTVMPGRGQGQLPYDQRQHWQTVPTPPKSHNQSMAEGTRITAVDAGSMFLTASTLFIRLPSPRIVRMPILLFFSFFLKR